MRIMNMNYMNWKNNFRNACLISLLVTVSFTAFAQNRPGREKLESARIALITERLNLTPEVAQQFWPVYNQVKEEERALRREEFQMRRSQETDDLTDAEAQAKMDQYFELKEQQLALEKKAAQQFREVLTPKQVLQLYKAEAEFQRMLLEKVGERGRRPGGRDEGPPPERQ